MGIKNFFNKNPAQKVFDAVDKNFQKNGDDSVGIKIPNAEKNFSTKKVEEKKISAEKGA